MALSLQQLAAAMRKCPGDGFYGDAQFLGALFSSNYERGKWTPAAEGCAHAYVDQGTRRVDVGGTRALVDRRRRGGAAGPRAEEPTQRGEGARATRAGKPR